MVSPIFCFYPLGDFLMTKILITGAAGYIGEVLVRMLLNRTSYEDYEFTCMDNCMYGQAPFADYINYPHLKAYYGDVRYDESFEKLPKEFDIVIPLACLVGAPICDKQPFGAKLINHIAIKKLVHRYPEALFIFPNTNSGYGTTDGETECTEETPTNPISLYAKTKCDAEKYIIDNAKSFVIFRLATVFGVSPRMRLDLMVNDFTYRAFDEGKLVIYEPHFKRNFVCIDDVAKAFESVIIGNTRLNPVNQVFNVGNDVENMTKLQLAEKIKEQVPNLKIEINEGYDIDKRNYIVSSKKYIEYFAPYDMTSVDSGIEKLLLYYNTFGPNTAKHMRNK